MRDASSIDLVNITKYGEEYTKMCLWYVHTGGVKGEKLK